MISPSLSHKVAADRLIETSRELSIDQLSFARQMMQQLTASEPSPAVAVLVNDVQTRAERLNRFRRVFGYAGVASRSAFSVNLAEETSNQVPRRELQIYDGDGWVVFNSSNGHVGLPLGRVIWYQGGPLLEVEGGQHSDVTVSATVFGCRCHN